ncbi:MAG TPA: hypothetical protein VLV50_13655, partial [Stellaceae bacterium]|nr:hypothetical protein [Stellaceae bacterium]
MSDLAFEACASPKVTPRNPGGRASPELKADIALAAKETNGQLSARGYYDHAVAAGVIDPSERTPAREIERIRNLLQVMYGQGLIPCLPIAETRARPAIAPVELRAAIIKISEEEGDLTVSDYVARLLDLGVIETDDENQKCRVRQLVQHMHRRREIKRAPTYSIRVGEDKEALRGAVLGILRADNPMTVRQVFYALVVRGVIEKTDNEYAVVVRLLGQMRDDEDIPFDWIVDNTRRVHEPLMHTSLADYLRDCVGWYRRDPWADADVNVQIWLEKDALAGVIEPVTAEYGVPLFVSRGFSSKSFLHAAAERINASGVPTYVYQFGDHDPSGTLIPRQIEDGLRQYVENPELVHFERVAVTPEQIEEWNLPTRPTKNSKHSADFEGDSVELDAIPADRLRRLVQECIERHITKRQLKK